MTDQNKFKQQAAEAALEYIQYDDIIGIGTGSTVNYFIESLTKMKGRFEGAVPSSKATEEKLKRHKIPIYDLNSVGELPVYIDGADEFDPHLRLIKGGGAALTREKIMATCSKKFICIVDESKKVDILGNFPLPIEVIPMARAYVARELVKLGGSPQYREGCITDNGNVILDVYNLEILDALALEEKLNNITGVVMNGIFARRGADKVLMASSSGVQIIDPV